jgi:hypothetical protein
MVAQLDVEAPIAADLCGKPALGRYRRAGRARRLHICFNSAKRSLGRSQ